MRNVKAFLAKKGANYIINNKWVFYIIIISFLMFYNFFFITFNIIVNINRKF